MMISRPYHVAIIDDNQPVCEVVQMTVQDHYGAEVLSTNCYESAPQALEAFQERPADIILLDINMPGMYGDTFLQEYLEIKRNAIVVIMSGDFTFTISSNCYLDGARFYLRKPFSSRELIDIIDNCLFQLDHWHNLFYRNHAEAS